jgi:hypothetical protein
MDKKKSSRKSNSKSINVKPINNRSVSPKRENSLRQKRDKSPDTSKKKFVKNSYELIQFKKMLGKQIIIPYKGYPKINIDNIIREKIYKGDIKIIILFGFINNGIVNIFDGIESLFLINNLSYADIKKYDINMEIQINQYTNLSPTDLIKIKNKSY